MCKCVYTLAARGGPCEGKPILFGMFVNGIMIDMSLHAFVIIVIIIIIVIIVIIVIIIIVITMCSY